MAKLPNGFYSWVEVYDYLKSKGVKYHTITMAHMNSQTQVVTKKKLTMRTVERNAWREINELRLTENHTNQVKCAVFSSYQLTSGIAPVERLLNKLQKHETNY